MVDCGVEVEKYRQVHLLLGVKKLVFETKALDLVEIFASQLGRDIKGGRSGYGFVGQVLRKEDGHILRADADGIGWPFWFKFPRQAAALIGIKPDNHGFVHYRHGSRLCSIDTHRCPTKASHLAKQAIQWHRSKTNAHH